ncbi:hypothetical protein LCGC14_1836540 [marine sediment metagenome]|uniref:Uncharacterized protein n=1 Tax=marine sediment metagenome TaxID=412755 RepID=A0A0F9GEN1_9ZZZZ
MITEINKHNRLLTPLRFVVAARAKETTRYAINQLFVEDDTAVATDGKRLHWFKHAWIKPVLESGFYNVVKCTKTILLLDKVENVGKFPKWQDIVPEHDKYFTTNTDRWNMLSTDLGGLGIGIHYGFLEPLGMFDCETLKVSFGEPDRPIKFSISKPEFGCNAVIMPVNYEKPVVKTEQQEVITK